MASIYNIWERTQCTTVFCAERTHSLPAVLGLATGAHAVELGTSAVTYLTPDQFKWKTNAAGVDQALLAGDPTKPGSLYVYINRFKPNRFDVAHRHPNDRFLTVIEGASWRGTGPVVDPAHAIRFPKGSVCDRPRKQGALGRDQGRDRRLSHRRHRAFHKHTRREDRRRVEWR